MRVPRPLAAALTVVVIVACSDPKCVSGPLGGCVENGTLGDIRGTVVVEGSGLSGVTVVLEGSTSNQTTTGSSGAFSFTSLAAGSYTVSLSSLPADVTMGTTVRTVSVADGQSVTVDFSGTFVRTSVITGVVEVTHPGTGESYGLSGVSVAANGIEPVSTTTDGQGRFSLGGLRAGVHTVTISGFDPSLYAFAPASRPVTVAVGETEIVGFAGTEASTATLTASVTVDDLPVAGVSVSISGPAAASVDTDGEGLSVFSDLPRGTYQVSLVNDLTDVTFDSESSSVTVDEIGGSASVAFSGSTGSTQLIAFASDRAGSLDIYTMRPDGSNVTRITTNSASDESPSWSPDGSRLAFSTDRDGQWEVYLVNANGGGLTRLTNNPAEDRFPAWQSGPGRVSFDSDRDGNFEIYTVNPDGSEIRRLTFDPDRDRAPGWAPGGQVLAFESDRDGNFEIYRINANGTAEARLTNTALRETVPNWSPDGTRIVYRREVTQGIFEIYVMNGDGSGVTQVTDLGARATDPSWSPDGNRIVFQTDQDGNYEIYTINVDGTGLTRLTNDPGFDGRPEWGSR